MYIKVSVLKQIYRLDINQTIRWACIIYNTCTNTNTLIYEIKQPMHNKTVLKSVGVGDFYVIVLFMS